MEKRKLTPQERFKRIDRIGIVIILLIVIPLLTYFAMHVVPEMFSVKAAEPVKLDPNKTGVWAYVVENGKIIKELQPEKFSELRGVLYFDTAKEDGKEQRIEWHGDYFLSSPGRQEFLKQNAQEQKGR